MFFCFFYRSAPVFSTPYLWQPLVTKQIHLKVEFELKLLKANQTFLLEELYNLTNINNKLSSDFKVQVHNLTTEFHQIQKKNQELQTDKKNLTEQIETIKKTWNEQNISQAQWSIDEYCRMENN
ncbi:hypothetical protein AMECASPLE_039368, partial [Ameca splendens]